MSGTKADEPRLSDEECWKIMRHILGTKYDFDMIPVQLSWAEATDCVKEALAAGRKAQRKENATLAEDCGCDGPDCCGPELAAAILRGGDQK